MVIITVIPTVVIITTITIITTIAAIIKDINTITTTKDL